MRRYVDVHSCAGGERLAVAIGAGGHDHRSERLDDQRAHGLDGCGVGRVADQAVHLIVSSQIDGTSGRDAEVGEAGAATVLDGGRVPELDDPQRWSAGRRRHVTTRRNRTARPGVSSAGGSRSASHSAAFVWPIRYQPPGDAEG